MVDSWVEDGMTLLDMRWKASAGFASVCELRDACNEAGQLSWAQILGLYVQFYTDSSSAATKLEGILNEDPSNPYLLLLKGKYLINEQQDLEGSEEIFKEIIRLTSNSEDIGHHLVFLTTHRLLGVIYYYTERFEEALGTFDTIIAAGSPVDWENKYLASLCAKAYANKVAVLGDLGDLHGTEEATDVCSRIFGARTEAVFKEQVAAALINLACALNRSGEPKRAEKVCDDIITKFNDEIDDNLVLAVTRTMINKASILLDRDDTEGALNLWEKVVENNKQNTPSLMELAAESLINIAIIAGRQGSIDSAICNIDKAVDILNDCDGLECKIEIARALVHKSKLFHQDGKKDPALAVMEQLKAVLAQHKGLIPPHIVALAFELRTDIVGELSADCEEAKIFAIDATKNHLASNLKVYLSSMNNHITRKKRDDYFKKMNESKSRTDSFLFDKSFLHSEMSLLLVLRQWNSYTPVIPVEEEADRGGGYYLRHRGEGIVIDPGYDFIDNFYRAGCRFCDIDHIIITHAHDDHTAEFEALIMLLHQYNKEKVGSTKRISLYLSQGAQRKFAGLIDLRDQRFLRIVSLCPPSPTEQQSLKISSSIELTTLPAYHDDVITRDLSVGLGFVLSVDEGERRIVFTGDSGLYPKKYGANLSQEYYDVARTRPKLNAVESEALHKKYPQKFHRPDLLVLHIGSIKEYEFASLDGLVGKEFDEGMWFYPNHLGILGSMVMLDQLSPSVAIVSEFGSELKDFFIKLVDILNRALCAKQTTDGKDEEKSWVIPGDLTIAYNIAHRTFLCHDTLEFMEHKYLKCHPGKECGPELDCNTGICEAKFKNNNRHRPYLFTEATISLPEREQNVAIKEYFKKLYNQRLPYHTEPE